MEKISGKFIKEFIETASKAEIKEYFFELLKTDFNANVVKDDKGFILDFNDGKFKIEIFLKIKVKSNFLPSSKPINNS